MAAAVECVVIVSRELNGFARNLCFLQLINQNTQAVTGIKAPKFGLGVFKWNIPPYSDVLMYAGVLGEGFTSAYTVMGNNIIISQSNTYNHNDFTMPWPHRAFTKDLMKNLH